VASPADGVGYGVEKGSIAIDGVSLTVTAVGDRADPWLEVSLIPETLARTTLGRKQPGDPVNLEYDVLAKYVERLLAVRGTGEVAR
jgi:riboflavin synthase